MEKPFSTAGFAVLPIAIPPPPSYPVDTTHYVYLRRNAPKIATPNDPRSLYISNVPTDSTEAHFRALFSALVGAGRFESITFDQDRKKTRVSHEPAQAERLAQHHKKRKREDEELQRMNEEATMELPALWMRGLHRIGSSAIVLLADEKCVDLVLKAVKKVNQTKKYPVWGEGVNADVPALGSQWLKSHNKLTYPGNDAMQVAVDAYFVIFRRKEEEANQLAKRLRSEPDEDGFVMVTRGGRSAPARRDEAEEARRNMLAKEQKKKDETKDFYRFQLREQSKNQQRMVLAKFNEDRKKMMAMRAKRRGFFPES
ncbi:ribosomal RNA-processing protein 7-domain-containing protein [Xylaria intraflava]|nr:ribosomal RNA-processing protein 7-domain-containing protein [Xylaria intraflava]